MSLKKNLVSLMKKNNLTVNDLASITDISIPTIKRLRTRDDCNPTLDVLQKISTALNTNIDQLTKESKLPIFFQGEKIELDNTELFLFCIVENIFDFRPGNKLEFRIYRKNQNLTKYILCVENTLLETLSTDPKKFKAQNGSIVSLEDNQIKACITKQIEVHYD